MVTLKQEQLDAARKFVDGTINGLTDEKGVHAETAVAAAARLAGTFLFRSFGFPAAGMTPGQAVFSDMANEQGSKLISIMESVVTQLGIKLDPAKLNAISQNPPAPNLTFLETQKLLEPAFIQIKDEFKLTPQEAADSAAIAAGMLIQKTAGVLDPHSSFVVAVYGFVQGTKTAPDPVQL